MTRLLVPRTIQCLKLWKERARKSFFELIVYYIVHYLYLCEWFLFWFMHYSLKFNWRDHLQISFLIFRCQPISAQCWFDIEISHLICRFSTLFWYWGFDIFQVWLTWAMQYRLKFFLAYISVCSKVVIIWGNINCNMSFSLRRYSKIGRHQRVVLNFKAVWKCLPPLLWSTNQTVHCVTDLLLLIGIQKH